MSNKIRIYAPMEEGQPFYIVGDKDALGQLSSLLAVAVKNGSAEMKSEDVIQVACVEPTMVDKMPPSIEGDNGSAIFLYEHKKALGEKNGG